MAAKRAEEVIDWLATEERVTLEEIKKRTKHGEHRINRCHKYDLPGGYRLICVKQGNDLVVLYIGAHDDCDRWLNNNRGFQPSIIIGSPKNYSVQRHEPEITGPEKEPEPEVDYDELLMEKIDEKTLRRIFRGLCANRINQRRRN